MTIRILGKKAIAIIMTMAILISCAALSFAVNAESTLLQHQQTDPDRDAQSGDMSTVVFYHKGDEVGRISGAAGSKFTRPVLSLNAPYGSEIAYYSDEACTQPIELPTVYPAASQNIYVKAINISNITSSFEDEAVDTVLSLNTDGAAVTVSDAYAHSGNCGARVVTLGNAIPAAPQMTVSGFYADPITVEKGKNYRVSFYVLQPLQQPDYDIRYWLAATDADTAFTTVCENPLVDTQTVTVDTKDAWQRVVVLLKDCAYSGKLRLGITGSTDAAHMFYIDDIAVEEYEDADADAMNFEKYEAGTALDLNRDNNTIIVTDAVSYTGEKSVHFFSDNNTYDSRPHMFVRDADGNIIKVKKGDDFYVSFMVYIPTTEPPFSFSYWLAATPEADGDKPFRYSANNSTYSSRNFVLPGEVFGALAPPAGQWSMIRIAVMDCPYEGNLRIGLAHGNRLPFSSNFYIDDIKLCEPQHVLLKFDSNGAESTYEDIPMMSDMLIPFVGGDPRRQGYDFMGWHTSEDLSKESYIDINTQAIVGEEGDVVTLYACWKEWDEFKAEYQHKKDKYEIEYYTEKVWVGDQNVPKPLQAGDVPTVNEAAPTETAPDPILPDADGVPPWLIVVIIIGAVVMIGGGAVIAAVLYKKHKKA